MKSKDLLNIRKQIKLNLIMNLGLTMTLSTYNFLWGILKFFLSSYLVRRQKKVRKINIDLMKGMEFQKIATRWYYCLVTWNKCW